MTTTGLRAPVEDPRVARKEELFAKLRGTYDLLQRYQEEHGKTGYGCVRSGGCCQVGLQLHMMECEHIAQHVLETTKGDPGKLKAHVRRLKRALKDEAYTWSGSIGDQMCAFYDEGCTIYPIRPAICRMYGVVLEADDFCPRERLAGRSFVYVQPDIDRMVMDYYRTLDAYGRLYPEKDYTVYMPMGVLSFLLTPGEMRKLRKATPRKFLTREKGYRTQFRPSYRRGASLQTNVKVAWAIPPKPRA